MPLVVMRNDRGWNRVNVLQVRSVRVEKVGLSDGTEWDVRCYGAASPKEESRVVAVYSFKDEDLAENFAHAYGQFIERPHDWKVLPG